MKVESRTQVHTAQILFFLNAAVWLALGLYTLTRMAGRYPGNSMTVWIIGLLVLGNAGAMLVAGLLLGLHRRWTWLLALALLAINILLTFTDQFGLVDFITLVIDLVLFAWLIATRKLYLVYDG